MKFLALIVIGSIRFIAILFMWIIMPKESWENVKYHVKKKCKWLQ